jgi:hypothetical protein
MVRAFGALASAGNPVFSRPPFRTIPGYTFCRMCAHSGPVPFEANVELLRLFLTHREQIVESIEGVLNAHRKPVPYLQDHALLSRQFEDCFLARTEATASQSHLRNQLEEAHWAAGFRPRPVRDLHNDLIHPAEMMIRAFYCWQLTRWPGRNGRMHYAHTLFNLYVLRWLQFLSMRLWDDDPSHASGRLAKMQGVLDALWRSSPAGQPALVRDARWLIPLAQSLITDELAPYFEVARHVAETLPKADALEIQKAHVRMIGGHLTSQTRYYCAKEGAPIHEPSVVLRTRTSNALDFALLIQGLVALLQAYDCAWQSGDERIRLDLAGAIFQGLSADPELFLNRVDLLSAYSMIEHVFIARETRADAYEGPVVYSPAGQRQVRLLQEYGTLIERLIQPLRDDLPRFRPVEGGCSPYGVIFGLPTHLIEHMSLKAMQHDAETRFCLEDVFDDDVFGDGNRNAAKLAWVNGWRDLPHIDPEVQGRYEYPQRFAEDVYGRIESEFGRASGAKPFDPNGGPYGGPRTGRLYLVNAGDPETDSMALTIPELPARYFACSDKQMAAAHQGEPYDAAQLLAGRREAHFLVSYETVDGWIALKKELLTEVLGAGRDARISGLPRDAAQVLRLMCTDLMMPENEAGSGALRRR